MKYLISKITGRFILTCTQKENTRYEDTTIIILPNGEIAQVYSTVKHDDIIIQVETHVIL